MLGNYRTLSYIPQPSEILNRYIFLHSYNLRNLKDKIKKETRQDTQMKMLPFQRTELSKAAENVAVCVTPGSHGAHFLTHLPPSGGSGSSSHTDRPL